jgi:signal transduction histidine kinase
MDEAAMAAVMSELNKNARLLIVDDNVANICLLENVLNRFGFRHMQSVTDSRQTVALVERFSPDLIVLDLHMPQLDGFGVMQQLAPILARETFLPVLVLTADISAVTKRKALAAGASDLLTKPIDASEVFMRIRNLLEIRFLHKQLHEQNQTLESKVAERTRALREMQQQVVAQERLRAFGEMAGGVVHDFNNALMSVIGYSEILLQDDEMLRDLKTARNFLTIMNTAGKDASQVISRLRDFYRPRELADVFTSVNINDLLEQAVPLTQPKWRDQALASGRAINVQLDLAKVPPVAGNPAELREVATNLIFNAVDAIPGDGSITLRTDHADDKVIIEVIDTGSGMSDEVRARCLEPFFSTKGDHGTGLGLSMVFGIINRHEGNLEIESELGKGTTFRLTFPAQTHASVHARGDASRIERSLRVLVVDDEPVNRDVLQKYLAADGHKVVTAVTAEQAIGCARTSTFDLLITDHAMPGMNGMQLAAVFRQMRSAHPVILVTGFTDAMEDPAYKADGVDLILRKPVPRADLRRALTSVMGS